MSTASRWWWTCLGEMSVLFVACVPTVLTLTSFADMVCDLDLSLSGFDVSESQISSISRQ